MADENEKSGNVGLLIRVNDKTQRLRHIEETAARLMDKILTCANETEVGLPFGNSKYLLNELYGEDITSQLSKFCRSMESLSLIDWSIPHQIHLPLIDWHWYTYCGEKSHRTTLNNVYALGDSSGHARGLLQASLSGWIAAEEYLDADAN